MNSNRIRSSDSSRPSIKPLILNLKGGVKKNNSNRLSTWVPKLDEVSKSPLPPYRPKRSLGSTPYVGPTSTSSCWMYGGWNMDALAGLGCIIWRLRNRDQLPKAIRELWLGSLSLETLLKPQPFGHIDYWHITFEIGKTNLAGLIWVCRNIYRMGLTKWICKQRYRYYKLTTLLEII